MSESCPRCGNEVETLSPIDTGMRLALKSTGQESDVPDAVCADCLSSFSGMVSQGFKLRMEREARNKNKVMMWKNRVNLVKNARTLMANKSYTEAAVAYEKYLRLLEVVYNLERGQLSPSVFNNSTRSKEMTVIASVYWDLVRIYDTNSGYGDRMKIAADKLAQFLPFSPLYPDIVKKAEQFARGAKNPHIIRQLLRSSKAGKGPCFVATAVFEDEPLAWQLDSLRLFRDEVLLRHAMGRAFIRAYYRHGPAIASRIRRHRLKLLLKPILSALAWTARYLVTFGSSKRHQSQAKK